MQQAVTRMTHDNRQRTAQLRSNVRRRLSGWRRGYGRALWGAVFLFAAVLALSDIGIRHAGSSEPSSAPEQQANPRANFWRYVREGHSGYTAQSGPYTTSVLIQNGGDNWRQLRNGPLIVYGAGSMAAMLAAIVAFFLFRGRIRLKNGRSGIRIPRFTLNDRVLHWFTAVNFIVLAVTGLILLYGRALLIPVIGFEAFAALASAGKFVHNLFGPIFVIALVLLIVNFARGNLPAVTDFKWLRDGGGLFGKHASSGRYNAGEKLWFWLVALAGIAVSITGLILDFPLFEQTRAAMQWSQTIHAAGAILLITGALGHIYIGTLGMEGALESMTQGSVDANWAKEHHDLWYADVARRTRADELQGAATRPGATAKQGRRA